MKSAPAHPVSFCQDTLAGLPINNIINQKASIRVLRAQQQAACPRAYISEEACKLKG